MLYGGDNNKSYSCVQQYEHNYYHKSTIINTGNRVKMVREGGTKKTGRLTTEI